MHNTSRRWLVGIGLMVALLALATPALAQNVWVKQGSPAAFPTPVQTMAVNPAGTFVSAGTYGGGYPGGNLGYQYYSLDGGVTFTQNPLTPCAPYVGPGDDYTSSLWDGPYGYTGTWNSGLYVWDGVTVTNPTCGATTINQHVSSLAFDSGAAGAPIPHVLYFGTWGGGIYRWTGSAFANVFNPLPISLGGSPVNGVDAAPQMAYIHQLVVVPSACPGVAPIIYAGTDGAGVLKGVGNCTTGNFTWTTVNTGLANFFVTSIAQGAGHIFAGTKAGALYDLQSGAWVAMAGSPADRGITTQGISNILAISTPNFIFAATEGDGVYRFDTDKNSFFPINDGYLADDLTDLNVHCLAFDPATQTLYAGTTDHVSTTTGNVWRILLAPMVLGNPWPLTYEVGDTVLDVVPVTGANQGPWDWTSMVTAGNLPPGLSDWVRAYPPYPPSPRVSGSPTADGCFTGTLSVWDALLNRANVPFDYTILPGVSFTITPNPAPLGTVQEFHSFVTGATGTVSYHWDFDSTGVQVAPGTWVSTDANPTFIYPDSNTYVVELVVTDTGTAAPSSGCTVTNTKTVTNYVYCALTAQPTATQVGSGAQFQFKANAGCGNPATCAGPSSYTYAWVFKDANTQTVLFTSSQMNPVITFAYTGDFIGELTVTCGTDTATASVSVNYNGPMSASIHSLTNPFESDTGLLFTATAQATAAYTTYTCTFDFGDGNVSPLVAMLPNIDGVMEAQWPNTFATTCQAPGTMDEYTVTATITADDGPGPLPPHTTIVHMIQKIYPQFKGITAATTPDPVGTPCTLTTDRPLLLTLQPNGLPDCTWGGLKPFRYSVDWGDGATSTADYDDYAAHSFPPNTAGHYYAPGTYTINYYVTDHGNPQITKTGSYGPFTVVAPLDAAALPTVDALRCDQTGTWGVQLEVNPQYGASRNVVFAAGLTGGTGTYSYTWDFGDGSAVSHLAAPAHLYTLPVGVERMTYIATVSVVDTADCSNHAATGTIKFTIYRTLTHVGTPLWAQQCGNRSVHFDATGNFVGGITPYVQYSWNFDDGTPVVITPSPVVDHVFAASGGYDVQVTIYDSARRECSSPALRNTDNIIWHIEVVDPLLGTASATPTTGCAPLAVAFTSSVTGGGQPGNAFELQWNFGDGSVTAWGASATQNHTYTTAGTYTWTLTARSTIVPANYICQIASGTIHVYAPASGFMIVPTSTSDYIPLDDTFTTTWAGGSGSVNLTYTMTRIKDKDGNFLPIPEVFTATANGVQSPYQFTYTFNNTGTWTVVCDLTDTATNCPDPTSNTVTVQVLDTPALTVTTQTLINGVIGTSGLSPLTVNFSSVPQGGVAPYTFLWTFADGTTSTAQNPIHTYNTPGLYHVTLQVTDSYPALAGGPQHATAAVDITVYNPLTVVASATSATTLVAGGTVNFSATATGGAGGYTYTWNFGDGGVGTGATTSHVYATAGTYFARVHVTDIATNFVDSNDVVIRVLTPVTVAASATPSTVIVNNPVTFTALASGGSGTYTIAWTFGDGTNGAGGTVNHTYTTLGTKTVVVTVTDNALASNVATQTIQVVVKPVPPSITYAKKLTDPFRIVLFGSNFQNGCVATINGVPVTVKFINGGKIKLKNAKSLCPKGVPVTIVVTNPDGGVSNSFQFVR